MSKKESIIKEHICEYLKSIDDLYLERREALGPGYKKGVPDLFAVYKGYHIEIETKREKGGRLSTMQEKFASKARNYGMVYVLAESVDDIKDIIKKIDEA